MIAIGNGTACRETEELLTELLANELKDDGVAYVIVNEAGASVYSTSPLGREEFPEYDATLRSAISIGRRLQDPLSELVKIDPGSIGVGLVSARREGQAPAHVAGCRGRIVRELRRRRCEHGQPGAAAVRFRLESTDGAAAVRPSAGQRAVSATASS